jgi:4-amino-4-deoxy-L-arabinose transferase-like glycosyltransferase
MNALFDRLFDNPITARLLPIVWLVSLAAYIFAGMPLTPFHADESTQIAMSRDAWAIAAGDLDALRYLDRPADPAAQELRLINGTLNAWAIGAVLALSGYTPADLPPPWDWGASIAYNVDRGARPTPEMLALARLPSTTWYALGLLPMFALGWRVGGRIGAFIAVFLYALHPALLVNGRRAMMEGGLVALSLFTVWAGAWLVRLRARPGRGYVWAAGALGAAAGLALASKHTAVFTVVSVYAAALALILATRMTARTADAPDAAALGRRPRRLLAAWALSGVIALGIFYLLTPTWWGDPVGRAGEVLRLRADLLRGQTDAFGGYDGFGAAFNGWLEHGFFPFPQFYEVGGWAAYLSPEIGAYQESVLDGMRDLPAGGLEGLLLGVFMPFIALAGAGAMIGKGSAPLPGMATSGERALILSWALTVAAATLLLTPLAWQRYYLPFHPALIVLVTAGMAWATRPARRPPRA